MTSSPWSAYALITTAFLGRLGRLHRTSRQLRIPRNAHLLPLSTNDDSSGGLRTLESQATVAARRQVARRRNADAIAMSPRLLKERTGKLGTLGKVLALLAAVLLAIEPEPAQVVPLAARAPGGTR